MDSQRDQLIAKYNKLEDSEKTLVQFLSVFYTGVALHILWTLLKQTKIPFWDNPKITKKQLTELTKKLKNQNLITQDFRCNPDFSEHIMMFASENKSFTQMVRAIRALPSTKTADGRFMREMRIGIYTHNSKHFFEHWDSLGWNFLSSAVEEHFFHSVFNQPFQPHWFKNLPFEIQAAAIDVLLNQAINNLNFINPELYSIVENYKDLPNEKSGCIFRHYLASIALLKGELNKARNLIKKDKEEFIYAWVIDGACDFLENDSKRAIKTFDSGLKLLQKASKEKNIYFSHFASFFHLCALLEEKSNLNTISKYIEIAQQQKEEYLTAFWAVEAVAFYVSGFPKEQVENMLSTSLEAEINSLSDFFTAIAAFWVNPRGVNEKVLEKLFSIANASGYHWIALESAQILQTINEAKTEHLAYLKVHQKKSKLRSLNQLIKFEDPWKKSLQTLAKILDDKVSDAKKQTCRLAWFIKPVGDEYSIQPKEQKLKANGTWSKGRQVALHRLFRREFDYITAQDQKVCREIYEQDYSYYYDFPTYGFSSWKKTLLALVNHPLVFSEDTKMPIEVVQQQPELITKKEKDYILIKFAENLTKQDVVVITKGPNKIHVVEVNEKFQKIAEVLGEKGLKVPLTGKAEAMEIVNKLSSISTVHTSGVGKITQAKEIDADSRIYVLLSPLGEGLKVELVIKPLGENGPGFKPGTGGEVLIAEIQEQSYQTQRNLKQEQKTALCFVEKSEILAKTNYSQWEWHIEDLESCLQLVLELQEMPEIVVEWPQGKKFGVSSLIKLNQMHINVKKQRDWFAISGQIKIDDNLVWDMKKLLDSLATAKGRFLPLKDGQFLALSNNLRKRLEELSIFGETTASGVKVHPLAALALGEFSEEVGSIKGKKAFKQQLEKIKHIQEIDPQIPSTLQAQLRDYQIEGFKWLVRLSHWGVGACLADDMGLGKTVQALALILTRAPDGPTLAIAPTSVCMNWEEEAIRFAPTLKPILFDTKANNKILNKAGSFDLVITSYGMLQSRPEVLQKVHWKTIVLDEAQAIKNFQTKRSKEAMQLKGDFKLITTGTPIENHLGELWNLFRFINPGLLGSLESFNRRFAAPIEKFQEREIQKQLKKLIDPFVLRRIKSQVLEELPPRTEIVLHVQMSPKETAIYEALRQEAIAKLEQEEFGARNFKILAEIMKLRRVCCHPSLITGANIVKSTKLEILEGILNDLKENHHKALIFSQFVDYLQIIRKFLEKHKVSYQYLDGSTPTKERKNCVKAFQSGEGDVFLISLKAGGLGLNLTAADYVVHMDPWWNPAVEDQATDRAHRIGQKRPVTVYRLVTKGTIEEKIVKLHQEKRDLAFKLLSGNEIGKKINAEELLELLRGDL